MELRRTPTIPDNRQPGTPVNEYAMKWRRKLDDDYNFFSNPYTAWRAKRRSVEERIAKETPNYTQHGLEQAFKALGLGVDTDPGDFNRDDTWLGMGSRAMQKAWNSAGMLKDSYDQWSADKRGDTERVMSEQEQLEDQALEIELIDRFQKSTSYGQNVVTQFLFDLASSAPIMAGVMVGGIALGSAATAFGAPFWLAGMLGMGVVDALSEMGFNWADIMTNPEVRKKIESSLGQKLSEKDYDAIGQKTQELLMEEADTSIAKVGIVNFFNPLNYVPALNKFSKLMKIGSGRVGTIGRQALVSAGRESVEEFGQSVLSQYTAGEAQMKAMSKAGVKDIPQLDTPDLFQAGYEALMGFTVGGVFGGFSGSRGYSKYFDPNSDMLGVDADGNPVFKQPNEKDFQGAGSLRMQTRKMVDASNPVLLDDWLNGTKEDGTYRLDPRERLIINDELERMRYNKELLGDKTSPEKRKDRQENAYDFEEYLKDKEGYIEKQKPQEQRDREAKQAKEEAEAELKLKEEEEKILAEEEILKPVEVQVGQSIAIVNKEAAAKVEQILRKPANRRTEREIEYLRLAQENPDKTYKQIVKMIKEQGVGDDFLSPKPKPVTPPKTGKAGATVTQAGPEVGDQAGTLPVGGVGTPVVTQPVGAVAEDTTLTPVLQQMLNKVEDLTERLRVAEGGQPGTVVPVGDVTLETIPTISGGILNKNDSVKEIMNTLNESAQGQNLTYSKKETQKLVLESIRDLKKAQKIEPFKDVPLPDKTNKEGVLITGRTQKTDYDVSANDRLTILKSLSKKLGIPIQVRQPTATADVDADVVEGTAVTTEAAPGLTYNKNYDENGNEINPKFPLEHLETLVNTEIIREQPKTVSHRYKLGLTEVSARHKGGEPRVRTSDELVTNPAKGITRLRYMGLNKEGIPYFNLAYVREDRTGSTVKGVPVEQREIIDNAAVAHLLSGQQETFSGVKETSKGQKVADRSYTTVTALTETPTSEQADAVLAIQKDLDEWNSELETIEAKGETVTPEEVGRYEELIEKIAAHNEEKKELLKQVEKTGEVTVREGGERPEHVPLNALGSIQKDINKRQSNLRKKLKKNKDGLADITTNEEVDITLARIEAVFGEELGMDHDFGVQVEEENSKSITSLRMSKTTPISTSSLEYALRINGWELVNKDMDGLVENEIEVKVGENIPVKDVIKYTEDIIVGGINWTQRAKDQTKFLNEKTEESLKTKSDEWWGTREGLSDAEKGSAQRQAAGIVRDIDVQTAEETLPGSNWRRSARKWFTTAKAQKTPPKKSKNQSGLSTPDAIKMVRQQMKALDGVTNKSVDATTDEQILEFLWAGPGQEGSPTIAATVLYDSTNSEHQGFDVDVEFKNGKTATIVPRWGKSNARYQALAEEIANSNAQQVGLTPEGKQTRRQQLKTALEKSKAGKKTAPEKKGREYSAAELAELQRNANAKAEAAEAAAREAEAAETTTEEVITPPEESTGVNELALINVKKGGELQKSMPPADARDHGSARFDKLRALPKYRDASLWDASNIDIDPNSPSKALTDQIKLDLGEAKPAGLKPLTDLIRRKLQDYLVLEIQTTEDVEGLKAEIDKKYWDLLVGPGHTAINNALKDRGSTKIDRGNKKTPTTSKKKDEKLATPTIERAGFIIDNVASATISGIPTKNPQLNDIWLIDPNETSDLFYEEAAKSQNAKTAAKNIAELKDFLALTNNGDFFVVKKTDQWSDAYILLRGDTGAPTKGKGKKIQVPQAIRTRLSREGKFFNAQREDFPTDKQGRITQRSRKLVREELTSLKNTLSSELFMQLFRSQSVDLNVLQEALDEGRVTFVHDSGGDIDTSVEIFWKNKDGTIETNGLLNSAMMKFNDRSQIDAFVQDIRKKNPEEFDFTEKEFKKMLAQAASTEEQVQEVFDEASIVDGSNAGITSVEEGIVYDSADVPLDSEQDVESDLEDIVTWSEEEAGKDIGGKPEEGGESLESKIARREQQLKDEAAKPGAVKRLAEDPPEGAEPVSLEVVTNIVEKFREQFPGSANIVIHTGEKTGFKGVYSPRNNTTYIVVNEHFSEKDVVQTLWHEGIGHGIQNIMTAEEFLELQQLVETHMPDRFQEELDLINEDSAFDELADSEKISIAAQEVIADFANDLEGQNATVVESITAWLRKVYNSFAKALGLKQLDLTEGDVRALLSETADAFRKPRDTGRASDYVIDTMTPEVDTSLQRRTVSSQTGSFDRTSLSESDRAAWNKIYERKIDANPGGWWKNIRKSLQSQIFDPYAVISDEIGPTQYMVSRLAGRADGVITTLLKYTGVKVKQTDVNGVKVNETVLDPTIKGLFTILKPLGTVQERQQLFGYGAYKRADLLRKQGRENFFSDAEIDRGLTWNQGRVKNAVTGVMVSREVLYDSIWKEISAMNNSVVDIGVKMDLLSKQSADNFQKEYYVPFYRLFEEEIGDGKRGNPVDYNSLTGQAGVKRLKGSGRPIGDPFNNLLHNWLHIIDASIKNDAANTTIRSALEITNPIDSSQMIVEPHYLPLDQSNTVRVKQGGVEKKFNINHDLLYKSLTALSSETKFPGFKHAIAAKGLFTKIVTAMPVFKYNNLVRDTITTAGTTDVGFNLINNAYAGIQSLRKDTLKKAQMLVSGGYIQFAYTRGDDPKYAETLLNKELTTGYIVENPETDKKFLSALKKANRMGRNLLDKYSKAGDMLENANRAKLFNKLLAEGKTQTEAAFEARDIMDFTLHGGADWVKLVTSLTPFANAMLQGKYKVGRAILNNPKPAVIVGGMVVLASLFESMYFEDDEEWQKRPDWDKDSFWQVKFPGTDTYFNIPKPHEFALVGNMAWRALDMARGNDPVYGEALVSGIKTLVSREFGIVPIPQIVKPFVEVGMNRNIFFDRDIEPMGSRGLSPSKRYGMHTSETAILASQLLEHIPIDKLKFSPYQLEHLIMGYFGWIGQEVLSVADYVTRGVGDFPERPARELTDYYMARRVFKSSPLRNTKAGTVFYKRLKELEQAVQDANLARKLGHMDEYREIYEEKGSLLKFKSFLRKKGRMVNDFNARIKRINFDLKMGGEEKAVRIDRLYQLRNDLLKRITESRPFQLSALR